MTSEALFIKRWSIIITLFLQSSNISTTEALSILRPALSVAHEPSEQWSMAPAASSMVPTDPSPNPSSISPQFLPEEFVPTASSNKAKSTNIPTKEKQQSPKSPFMNSSAPKLHQIFDTTSPSNIPMDPFSTPSRILPNNNLPRARLSSTSIPTTTPSVKVYQDSSSPTSNTSSSDTFNATEFSHVFRDFLDGITVRPFSESLNSEIPADAFPSETSTDKSTLLWRSHIDSLPAENPTIRPTPGSTLMPQSSLSQSRASTSQPISVVSTQEASNPQSMSTKDSPANVPIALLSITPYTLIPSAQQLTQDANTPSATLITLLPTELPAIADTEMTTLSSSSNSTSPISSIRPAQAKPTTPISRSSIGSSLGPTKWPSSEPLSPLTIISETPSSILSIFPSYHIPANPTRYELLRLYQGNNRMNLFPIDPLNSDSEAIWEQVTAIQIRDEIIGKIGMSNVEYLTVNITFRSQEPPYLEVINATSPVAPSGLSPRSSSSSSGNLMLFFNRARFQEVDKNLNILFGISINIRSKRGEMDHNINEYIEGAFRSEKDISQYLDTLTGKDSAFSTATRLNVRLPPSPTKSLGNSGPPSGLIGGLAAAGVVIVFIGGFVLFYRRKRRSDGPVQEFPHQSNGGDHDRHGIVSVIDLDQGDDLSTLGDPIPADLRMSVRDLEESSVADSVSLRYDFQREYLKNSGDPSLADVSSSLCDSKNSNLMVAKDDETLEEHYFADDRFEVDVPAGKLGLVLDTFAGSAPTVHAIKLTSPLSLLVQEGDRLCSVDGEDVTVMLASDVLRLIASKEENAVRRFVFTRGLQVSSSERDRSTSTTTMLSPQSQIPKQIAGRHTTNNGMPT